MDNFLAAAQLCPGGDPVVENEILILKVGGEWMPASALRFVPLPGLKSGG